MYFDALNILQGSESWGVDCTLAKRGERQGVGQGRGEGGGEVHWGLSLVYVSGGQALD